MPPCYDQASQMYLSVFDMFKIGVGPSSSHTMGPMIAASRFLRHIRDSQATVKRLQCSLHGSLAFTGKGHGTDRAVILGFAGFKPDSFDLEKAILELEEVKTSATVNPSGFGSFDFDPETDLVFDYDVKLTRHPNGLIMRGLDATGTIVVEQSYFSVGGGFVLTGDEFDAEKTDLKTGPDVPFPFLSAAELLAQAETHDKSIAEITFANECTLDNPAAVRARLLRIWRTMNGCIDAGLSQEGLLPGGLNVRRRAKSIYDSLIAERGRNKSTPHVVNDWISAYAMAVNEQNAAGAQVVTAPTNGAAGVIPGGFRYYLDHVSGSDESDSIDYLLTAGAIGAIIKTNASISGAEVGCQGEVGSASAMAAAGLCAILGGSPKQVENAAEIALEHHLGMTCDPVKGLVQAPCIERNALGAIKAISSASLALRSDGDHLIPLDACIETMRQTGIDMSDKYKETSTGGLAVNTPVC